MGGDARRLEREDEAVRRLVAPLLPAVGLEAGIVGAVDLDRRQLAAGIGQLFLLLEVGRIEVAAPGLEGPAAYTDPYLAAHSAHMGARPFIFLFPASRTVG